MIDGNKNSNDQNTNKTALFVMIVLATFFVIYVLFNNMEFSEEISYTQFMDELEKGTIESVSIMEMQEIRGFHYDSQNRRVRFTTLIPYFDENLLPKLQEYGVPVKGQVQGVSLLSIFLQIFPALLVVGFIIWMYKNVQGGGKQAMMFGRSRAKRYDATDDNVTFKDVAGQQEAKYELEEVVGFLKSPQQFTKLGAKIPKGVLLIGQPGTGKTLLAKAVAGEAEVPFFHMSGSDFVEMFVGVGASRVRDMFEQGRKNAPCILFIDEIDAVGRTRGAGYGGGHDEREQTLNQLLVEMDGFNTDKGVIVIAATNRADVLDPALLRPGRFDRQVIVPLPDVQERHAIFQIHANNLNLKSDVDLLKIARATPGSSGADIANIVNEAALYAGRVKRDEVTMDDFEEARDKILMGVARKSMVMDDHDKLMTAYHEAGHTLLHYFQDGTDPIHKVTIIPRGQALGVTFSLPDKDQYSRSISWLNARLSVLYGGYAAEELIFNETTTGAQNDIRQATELARKMVCEWGMSDLGPVAMGNSDEPIFIGKEIAQHADYSDGTALLIDEQIRDILNNALNKARQILKEKKDFLVSLSEALVEKETMDDKQIRALWGLNAV